MSSLILITPPTTDFPKELHLLPRMFDLGLTTLHLRKPQSTQTDIETKYLAKLPPPLKKRIVVHQHYDLAHKHKLKGIHYKSTTLPDGIIAAQPGLTQSCSFHQLPQLGFCRGDLDYCFLSPIYDSISKQGYKAGFEDRDELAHCVCTSRYPVVALGGVTVNKFEELAALGFSGVALLGSIWDADDPFKALKQALDVAEQLDWSHGGGGLTCSTIG